MTLNLEEEAKILGDFLESVRRLLTESRYTADHLMGIIDEIVVELEDEEVI